MSRAACWTKAPAELTADEVAFMTLRRRWAELYRRGDVAMKPKWQELERIGREMDRLRARIGDGTAPAAQDRRRERSAASVDK